MELRQFGISVVVVQPSFVSTEIDVTRHMTTNGGAVDDYATLEQVDSNHVMVLTLRMIPERLSAEWLLNPTEVE